MKELKGFGPKLQSFIENSRPKGIVIPLGQVLDLFRARGYRVEHDSDKKGWAFHPDGDQQRGWGRGQGPVYPVREWWAFDGFRQGEVSYRCHPQFGSIQVWGRYKVHDDMSALIKRYSDTVAVPLPANDGLVVLPHAPWGVLSGYADSDGEVELWPVNGLCFNSELRELVENFHHEVENAFNVEGDKVTLPVAVWADADGCPYAFSGPVYTDVNPETLPRDEARKRVDMYFEELRKLLD